MRARTQLKLFLAVYLVYNITRWVFFDIAAGLAVTAAGFAAGLLPRRLSVGRIRAAAAPA